MGGWRTELKASRQPPAASRQLPASAPPALQVSLPPRFFPPLSPLAPSPLAHSLGVAVKGLELAAHTRAVPAAVQQRAQALQPLGGSVGKPGLSSAGCYQELVDGCRGLRRRQGGIRETGDRSSGEWSQEGC
jgi:hypothetical protein